MPKQPTQITDEFLLRLISDVAEFGEAGAGTFINVDELAAMAEELLKLRKTAGDTQ